MAESDIGHLGLGGIVGIGGIVYAFAEAGQWLEDPELIDEAHGLASLITEERIRSECHGDIVFGLGGTILALLAISAVRPEKFPTMVTPLELAELCASQLLRKDYPCRQATGFSHGASGVAAALLSLFETTGRQKYLDGALINLEAERRIKSSTETAVEERAAAALERREPSATLSWCRGSSGEALARSLMFGCTDRVPDISIALEEMNLSLDRVARALPGNLDHLCCGNMGRVAVLLSAFRRTEDSKWLDAAHGIASEVISRLLLTRRLRGDEPDPLDISLFRGVGGIAHTVLRLSIEKALGNPQLLQLSVMPKEPSGV